MALFFGNLAECGVGNLHRNTSCTIARWIQNLVTIRNCTEKLIKDELTCVFLTILSLQTIQVSRSTGDILILRSFNSRSFSIPHSINDAIIESFSLTNLFFNSISLRSSATWLVSLLSVNKEPSFICTIFCTLLFKFVSAILLSTVGFWRRASAGKLIVKTWTVSWTSIA